MSSHLKHRDGGTGDTYLALVQQFPLVSIRTKKQLKNAQKMVDSLLAREPLDKGEERYLDALSDLVAVYEDEDFVVDAPSDAALLRHLLEAKGVSQNAAAEAIGIPRSIICEVVSGKRELTRKQVLLVSDYFHVEPSVFMGKKHGS